jgi:hypothetical protein
MKYRFTPFHLPALYFLGDGFYTLYKHSQLENYNSLELGGIVPFMSIGFALIILAIDFSIQLIVSLIAKENSKKVIYIIECTILVIALLWYWLTFYPTVIVQ